MAKSRREIFARTPLNRKNKKKNNTIIYLICLAVFICIIGYLARLDIFLIKSVEVRGNKVEDEEEIANFVEGELAGNFLFLFPRKNILWYPERDLAVALALSYPRLSSIEIKLGVDNNLNINVSERDPKYIWCKEDDLGDEGDCYFMDEDGYVFAPSPKFSGVVYFKFIGKLSGEDPIGQVYLTRDKLEALVDFKDESESLLGGPFEGIKAESVSEYGEYDFSIHLDDIKIYFDKESDLVQTAERLAVVIKTVEFKSKSATDRPEYIDLRFGKKVFFKF